MISDHNNEKSLPENCDLCAPNRKAAVRIQSGAPIVSICYVDRGSVRIAFPPIFPPRIGDPLDSWDCVSHAIGHKFKPC